MWKMTHGAVKTVQSCLVRICWGRSSNADLQAQSVDSSSLYSIPLFDKISEECLTSLTYASSLCLVLTQKKEPDHFFGCLYSTNMTGIIVNN